MGGASGSKAALVRRIPITTTLWYCVLSDCMQFSLSMSPCNKMAFHTMTRLVTIQCECRRSVTCDARSSMSCSSCVRASFGRMMRCKSRCI
ncbi:hypothetical protein K437DRAFT_156783 [Tilletiaria anomala UBC 951]|uniref:Uncharacterized protein n=1 Tax=Tilletiaria anomala (strain ATCC 24038 / CBS 436.72 / UBC 951) TaxID=1037660 RepID=A0A066VMB9_TILAU|nr:uncharacterized protein K437DRAFT_156783 [Tilletiaria anomala UBC 951]KDN42862.1 hypothetical protein K437DRAFT_156783 [Tilletiaria anomala UBC 951]